MRSRIVAVTEIEDIVRSMMISATFWELLNAIVLFFSHSIVRNFLI